VKKLKAWDEAIEFAVSKVMRCKYEGIIDGKQASKIIAEIEGRVEDDEDEDEEEDDEL